MALSKTCASLSTSALDAMHCELRQLMTEYGSYLQDESIQGDVECLAAWIEAYKQGSDEAANYLNEYGIVLMEHIRTKLQEAACAFQRLDGESPASKSFSGRDAHKLNEAATLASHAEEELVDAIDSETKTN